MQNENSHLLFRQYSSFRKGIIDFFLGNVLDNCKSLMDPWCGTVSLFPYVLRRSKQNLFNDILPLHYHLNRAKQPFVLNYAFNEGGGKKSCEFLSKQLKALNKKRLVVSNDWFEDNILHELKATWKAIDTLETQEQIFARAILLLIVRKFSCYEASVSNPTWIKQGGMTTGSPLEYLLANALEKFRVYFAKYSAFYSYNVQGKAVIACTDASKLTTSLKFDTIFTSPPYCNRLDIFRMYAPELVFLSHVDMSIDTTSILGTTKVRGYDPSDDLQFIAEISKKTCSFLSTVKLKERHNENDYYLKYICRYYTSLFRTIQHIMSFLLPEGKAYFVVQNNSHRGELNKTAEFLIDFATNMGWKSCEVFREYHHHLGKRNISREYPTVFSKQEEHIVEMRKC